MSDPSPPSSSDAPEPADALRVGRVRRAVLERIAYASTAQHLTVPADSPGWQPFLDGVECKVLHEQAGMLSYLLRLAPGAVLPAHRHEVDEECLVLEGELRIGDLLVIRAGDYHLGRAGVLHAPISTDTGALIFLRGTAPDAAHCL